MPLLSTAGENLYSNLDVGCREVGRGRQVFFVLLAGGENAEKNEKLTFSDDSFRGAIPIDEILAACVGAGACVCYYHFEVLEEENI